MSVWKDSKVDLFFYDYVASVNEPCEVRIDGDSIVVSYEDDGEYVVYKGQEHGIGHYELKASAVDGRASLHMFPDGKILEGYWVEQGQRGMWRIRLA